MGVVAPECFRLFQVCLPVVPEGDDGFCAVGAVWVLGDVGEYGVALGEGGVWGCVGAVVEVYQCVAGVGGQ